MISSKQLELLQSPAPPAIKALSLKQPYAWALFHGKDIENRTWRTNHRGLLLIHASASKSHRYWNEACEVCRNQGLIIPSKSSLTYGAIIGAVDVVDCYWGEEANGWGFAQHWHWKIENPRLFKKPLPMKGGLSFMKTDLTLQEVSALCQ
jgi:hypothetical protein